VKGLHFQSILRSFFWFTIGSIFGLGAIGLVLASSFLFANKLNFGDLGDPKIVIFLFVGLMGGAGTDFLLTGNYPRALRGLLFCLVLIGLLIAWILLNPNNKIPPRGTVVFGAMWSYGIVSFIYCMILKSLLIYRERLNHTRAHLLTNSRN